MSLTTVGVRYLSSAIVLNALSVAVGLASVHLLFDALAGPDAARIALGTAVCASFADQPLPARRTAHRVTSAAALSVAASWLIEASHGSSVGLGLAVAGIGFVATLLLVWGPRAALVAFAPILATVFALAAIQTAANPIDVAGTALPWHVAGGVAYTLWAIGIAALLAGRYRRAALRDLIAAMSVRLRERAELVDRSEDDPKRPDAWRRWLFGEAAFADRLQLARDFVFDGGASERQIALLLRTVELRDSLVVSRFDRDLPGGAARRRWFTRRSAETLRRIASELDTAVRSLDGHVVPERDGPFDTEAAYDDVSYGSDAAHERYLDALRLRVRAMYVEARRIDALARGAVEPLPLSVADVGRFVSPERWDWSRPWRAVRERSPAVRHALRMAVAMALAYAIAPWLPWTPHPQWVVLSVAVVLRGSLEQTLARRNARVLGTLAGCVVVLALSVVASPTVLFVAFLVAVAVSHAFLTRRYWLAAIASTVMALLQSYAVDPATGFAIAERAGDTVVGALFAWGFSYLLPSWERDKLPAVVRATGVALGDYAASVLRPPATLDIIEQRLARNRAHDALDALSGVMQRTAVEPRRVRVSEDALTVLLDHGRRLMADVSAIRILLAELERDGRDVSIAHLLAEAEAALPAHFGWARSGDAPETRPGPVLDVTVVARAEEENPTAAQLSERLRSIRADAARVEASAVAILEASPAPRTRNRNIG